LLVTSRQFSCINPPQTSSSSRTLDVYQTGYKTKSVLCVPVPHGEVDRPLIGVVQLINKQGGACFDAEDEALLHDFCVHVGLALTALLLREDEQLFNRPMTLQEEEEDDDEEDSSDDDDYQSVPQDRQDLQAFTNQKLHLKGSRHDNNNNNGVAASSSTPPAVAQPTSSDRNQYAAPRRIVMDRTPQKKALSFSSSPSARTSSPVSLPGSRKRGHYSAIEEEEEEEDQTYRKRAHSPASPSSPSSPSSYSSPMKRGRMGDNGREAPRTSPTRRALPPPPPPSSLGYLQPNGCAVS
jgi:hypothetical protein